jgi:phosphatidylserine decarboxylase
MTLHKEGYKVIPYAALVLALPLIVFNLFVSTQSWVHYTLYGLFLVSIILVVRFFRHPIRKPAAEPSQVLCSSDGTVVAIEEVVEDEYFKDKRILVSVFMSIYNVHINWAPIEGVVSYTKYHPGKFLPAYVPKSSTLNERNTFVIKNKQGVEVLMRQIAGMVARRIAVYASVDQQVDQKTELGFIRFGSRVDIFLPLGSTVQVVLGQKVTGSETVLAILN